MIAWDTEWREVDRNRAEAVLSDFYRLIVPRCVLTLILRCFFSTLGDVLTSFKLGGNTVYLLIVFIILLYPLEVGVWAARFSIRITVLSIESGGTVDSIIVFEMEGEWTCLAEIWSGE